MTRRLAGAVAAGALVVLAAAGCSDAQPAEPAPAGPAPAAAAAAPPAIAESQQTTRGIVPGYTVSVPSLGVTSDLVGLGLNPDRTIEVPPLADPGQAGLYLRGPRPGQPGPAVILGHINGSGRAGFGARFTDLEDGDRVEVDTPDGLRGFRVTRVVTVPKADFPTADVYSDTPGPELRLITCGGELAGRNYLDQTIVYAALDEQATR